MGGYERGKRLYALARLIQKHSRLFAVLETLDNGKPIRETRDIDIPLVARHFYYHAGWAEAMEAELPGCEPLGVCGQIIPWNFPLLMLAWKIAPALAMGNAVVLKPAEYTSLSALLFAEMCGKAGLPPGVVNIVTGDGETGRCIVEHGGIDKIAFTGSTEVGRLIRKATAGTGKKLSLELGGKSTFIIFEDSDIDSAVEGLVDAIWFNQGQVCCASSRLLVQESISERVLRKVKARMEKLRVGDPLDKSIDIGAIIAPVQLERISSLVQQGVDEGAEIFQPTWACPSEGWFYPPTLLSNVSPASTVAQVEIFGPVLVQNDLPNAQRGRRSSQQHAVRLSCKRLDRERQLGSRHRLEDQGGNRMGEQHPTSSTPHPDLAAIGRVATGGKVGRRIGWRCYVRRVLSAFAGSCDTPTSELRRSPSDPIPNTQYPTPALDRTYKLYIGGKQVRPDAGYSLTIDGNEFGRGNRKDIRNAVEAARGAQAAWASASSHTRAQIMFFVAENLQDMGSDFALRTVFSVAARCDKFDGASHSIPMCALCYTVNEAVGVIGIVCSDDRPLVEMLELACGAIAMGNTVVVIPSEKKPAACRRALPNSGDLRRAFRRVQHRDRASQRSCPNPSRA